MRKLIAATLYFSSLCYGVVAVSLSPTAVTLNRTGTQQFTATVTGDATTTVTWSLTGIGTLSGSGLYTAPSDHYRDMDVLVTATSVADPTKSATSVVTYHRMRYVGTFFHDTSLTAAVVETEGYVNGSITLTELSGVTYDTVCSTWRDPSITKINGVYYVLSTDGGDNHKYVNMCSSTDLKTWTYVRQVSLDILTAAPGYLGGYIWAPEWFIGSDGTIRFYFATYEGGHDLLSVSNSLWKIYEVHFASPSSDVTTAAVSTPVVIGGLTGRTIDPFMVEKAGTFYLFYKTWDTGPTAGIKYASNSSPTGTFGSIVSLPDLTTTSNSNTWEAPGALQMPNGEWVLYADHYQDTLDTGRIDYYVSASDFTIYSPARVPTVTPGGPLKHGTLIQPTYTRPNQISGGGVLRGGAVQH